MRTTPVRTVTIPRLSSEPQIELIHEISECLEALRIDQTYERKGLPLHGIAACREFFREQWEKGR